MIPLVRLVKRYDFVKVAQEGQVARKATLITQCLFHSSKDLNSSSSLSSIRVGFTASKRVGNAVMRNKAKRRMREVVALWAKKAARFPSSDVVVIAKPAAVTAPFTKLQSDFETSLANFYKVTE